MKQYPQKISADYLFLLSCLFPLLLKHTTTTSVAMRITVFKKNSFWFTVLRSRNLARTGVCN